MHLKGYGLPRPQRRGVRPDCPGTGGRRLRPAHLRQRAGLPSPIMSAIHSTAPKCRSSSGSRAMAKGELIGCFGLTEPTAGSDPGGMTTYARKGRLGLAAERGPSGGSGWRPSPGRGDLGADRRRDPRFVVPTDTPGSPRPPSSRNCRCGPPSSATSPSTRSVFPADAVLPERRGLKGRRLPERGRTGSSGAPWAPPGTPTRVSCLVQPAAEAVRQTTRRVPLTQTKLVDMVLEIQKGILVALQTGRLKDAGTLHPQTDLVRQAEQRAGGHRDLPGRPGPCSRQRHHPGYSPLRHANNRKVSALRGHRRGPHPDHGDRPSPAWPRSGELGHDTTVTTPHAGGPRAPVHRICNGVGGDHHQPPDVRQPR